MCQNISCIVCNNVNQKQPKYHSKQEQIKKKKSYGIFTY